MPARSGSSSGESVWFISPSPSRTSVQAPVYMARNRAAVASMLTHASPLERGRREQSRPCPTAPYRPPASRGNAPAPCMPTQPARPAHDPVLVDRLQSRCVGALGHGDQPGLEQAEPYPAGKSSGDEQGGGCPEEGVGFVDQPGPVSRAILGQGQRAGQRAQGGGQRSDRVVPRGQQFEHVEQAEQRPSLTAAPAVAIPALGALEVEVVEDPALTILE